MKKLTKAESERISERMRNDLGLSATDPLCAYDLASSLKVEIFTIEQMGLTQEEHLHFNNGNSGKRFSAVSLQFPEIDDRIIIRNHFHGEKRTQATLMHELSHLILKHDVPPSHFEQNIWLPHWDPVQETQADMLGWALKLPRIALLKALKKGLTYEMISDHYNASIELVTARINTTGVKRQIAATIKKYGR